MCILVRRRDPEETTAALVERVSETDKKGLEWLGLLLKGVAIEDGPILAWA